MALSVVPAACPRLALTSPSTRLDCPALAAGLGRQGSTFVSEGPLARVTVEDCLERVGNRFALVILGAERARQLARSASEVGDAHVRMRIDERDKVPERLRAFRFEFLVLVGRPRAQRRRSQFMIAFITSA